MINGNVLNMVSVLNKSTVLTLEMVVNGTWKTGDFKDPDALKTLYDAGWINVVVNNDGEYWIMTNAGRELYFVLQDLVI